MTVQSIIAETDRLMKKTLEKLQSDFATVRTNRVSPALLEPVRVNFYGSQVPISQVGTVAVTEGKTIEIRPWDISVLQDLEKALNSANLGATPNNDGKIIRLTFPALSEDRRKDLVRLIKKLAEDFRVSLRNERRGAIEKVKKEEKDGNIPKDLRIQTEGKIQGLTNVHIKKVDETLAHKEKEILEI